MNQDNFPSLNLHVQEGMQIDNYRLLSKLGAGGMGVVYKAYDCPNKRQVAIKFMLNLADGGSGRERFLREVAITAQLDHPHIVHVYHVGRYQECPYFAMEYVAGEPLHKFLQTHDLAWPAKLELVQKVTLALQYAHAHGVIHRDIKPSNILVREDGEPVLMDFGLAKTSKLEEFSLTRTGEILGTPEYMSPEQARGVKRAVDTQSDVYSVGAVLYHVITGQPPVSGENLVDKVRQVIENIPRPKELQPDTPAAIDIICRKAMEKDKRHRYQSARHLADDIAAYLAGRKTAAERVYARQKVWRLAMASGLALLAIAAVVLALLWYRHFPEAEQPSATSALTVQMNPVQLYYETGCQKMTGNPQEAYLHFKFAYSLLATPAARSVAPEIRRDLPALVLRTGFLAGDYTHVYTLGKKIVAETADASPDLVWYVTCAAYHTQPVAEAQTLLTAMVNRFFPDGKVAGARRELLAEIRYCQGVLAFRQGDIDRAREFFALALAVAEGADWPFTPALYLYHCACLLADTDRMWNEQETVALAPLIQRLQQAQDALPPMLYTETRARYLLKKAALGGERQKPAAAEALKLIDQCLQNWQGKAVWYYLRCRACLMLGRYQEARTDCEKATTMDPSMVNAFIAKLDVLWASPQPAQLKNYIMSLSANVYRALQVRAPLFAQEFAALEQEYAGKHGGIPFNEELFREYWHKLHDTSSAIREVAKTALCNMLPHTQTQSAIRQVFAGKPLPPLAAEICSQLVTRQAEYERHELLANLTRVSFQSAVSNLQPFYPRYVRQLMQVLDDNDNMLLRALAAKVLVAIPLLEVRRELYQRYLQAPVGQPANTRMLANRIIVGYALQKIGYQWLDTPPTMANQMWETILLGKAEEMAEDPQHREFLLVLLADLLSQRDTDNTQVLGWLLEQGSHRVRLAASSRFFWPARLRIEFPSIYGRLVNYLQQAARSEISEVQAGALDNLAVYLDSALRQGQTERTLWVQEHFLQPGWILDICQRFAGASPAWQRSFLNFFRSGADMFMQCESLLPIARVREVIRPMFTDQIDPALRWQAAMTAASLWDREVFQRVSMSLEAPILDRMAAMAGAIISARQRHKQGQQDTLWLLGQVMQKKIWEDKDWRLPAAMLYIFANIEQREMLASRILQGITDKEPHVRFTAIANSGYLAKIPAKVVDKLRKISQQDSDAYVRYAAQSILLHCSLNEKTSEWQHIHRQVLADKGPDGDYLRQTLAWAYAIPWEPLFSTGLSRHTLANIEEEGNWHNVVEKFLQHIGEPQRRRDSLERLEKSLQLLATQPDSPLYQEHGYLLGLAYEMDRQYARALTMLETLMAQLKFNDVRCALLWTRLMVAEGRSQEAGQNLQARIDHAERYQTQAPSEELFQLAAHASMLRRCLIYLAEHAKTAAMPASAYHDQYLLAPQQPAALFCLGEYHFAKGEYANAVNVGEELSARLPQSGEVHLWLARAYARAGNRLMALDSLYKCYSLKYLTSLRQLIPYQELQTFMDDPAIRAHADEK